MKVLLINGSPHAKGSTYTALHEMEKVFTENGIEVKSYISEIKISAAVLPAVPVPSSENVLFPIW